MHYGTTATALVFFRLRFPSEILQASSTAESLKTSEKTELEPWESK